MVEFQKQKSLLESILEKIDFFYSGDIIKSHDMVFFKKLKHASFSPELLRDTMIGIYDKSFERMKLNSKEIILHRSKVSDIYGIMDELPFNPKILFYSRSSNLDVNLDSILEDSKNNLPRYFTRTSKFMMHNREVSAYFSPNIEDEVDDCCIYFTDAPIQSMVWSLQNMSYTINKGFSLNEHIIKLPFYDCNYKCCKVRVIDTIKLRNDKINSLLDGN